VRAASLAYFGKEPKRLSPAEAALLVALPQSPELRRPDRYGEAARRARNRVLDRIATIGKGGFQFRDGKGRRNGLFVEADFRVGGAKWRHSHCREYAHDRKQRRWKCHEFASPSRAYTGAIMKPHRLPVYFISHGGGPWSYMDDPSRAAYAKLEAALAGMPRQIGITPKAVLMISAHWEEPQFTLTSSPKPPMIYDYGGFPEYTYHIHYDAPGDPALAARVKALLEASGIAAQLDPERGFDHGAFTPLNVIYPNADVPVVQLSLKTGLDPATHLGMGRALSSLRDEGVLIVGSGLSYHNLREFFSPRAWGPSKEFDAWLNGALLGGSSADRSKLLTAWKSAPSARAAHPREEHLLPLMVAVGAAGDDIVELTYHEKDFLGGITVSSYCFSSG